MNPAASIAAAAALAGLAAAGTALAQAAGGTFSVRNDSGRFMECAVRKAGSSISDPVPLREDEEWRRTYPKAKPRNFRCVGAAPVWYLLKPGVRYRLAPTRDGLIVLVPI